MKKLITVFSCLLAASLFAEKNDEFGGNLRIFPSDHNTFFVVNAQKKVNEEIVNRLVSAALNQFNIDIRYVKGTAPEVKDAGSRLKELGANGALWIIDDPDYPITLGACEDGWAYLNVFPLATECAGKKMESPTL